MGRGWSGSAGGAGWLLVAGLLVSACGDAPPDDRARPDSPALQPDSPPVDLPPAPDSAGPAVRPATPSADTLREALQQLVEGSPGDGRPAGTHSWFSEETRNVLRGVELSDGRAVVDFDERLPGLIPGANSSAGSDMLLSALDSTVFQFPWVDTVEYRLGGSCPAFWEWLQRECVLVAR